MITTDITVVIETSEKSPVENMSISKYRKHVKLKSVTGTDKLPETVKPC